MSPYEDNFVRQRRDMIELQLRARGIRDERVLKVMGELPREKFIGPVHRDEAYEDRPVPIGAGQTISQPYVVALMTEALKVEPRHRVLEIGAGSGYQTAILAKLAKEVFAIERIAELAERASKVLLELGIDNVQLRVGDGTLGWPEQAPFDRILCAAAAPDVPEAWIEQLADNGRIVMPIGGPEMQNLFLITKQGDKITHENLGGVRFVKLIGKQGWEE